MAGTRSGRSRFGPRASFLEALVCPDPGHHGPVRRRRATNTLDPAPPIGFDRMPHTHGDVNGTWAFERQLDLVREVLDRSGAVDHINRVLGPGMNVRDVAF